MNVLVWNFHVFSCEGYTPLVWKSRNRALWDGLIVVNHESGHTDDASFADNTTDRKRTLMDYGYWWDSRPNNNCLRSERNDAIASLVDKFDQFVLEYIPIQEDYKHTQRALLVRRNKFNSWTRPKQSRGELAISDKCKPPTSNQVSIRPL